MELRTRKVLFLFISFLLYCTKKTPSNLVKKHLFASYGDILISRVRVIEKKAYVSTWRLLEVKGSKIYLEKEEKIPGEEPISKKKSSLSHPKGFYGRYASFSVKGLFSSRKGDLL